jgi:FlaA1/EpsC-like NDP-sugar epimerase
MADEAGLTFTVGDTPTHEFASAMLGRPSHLEHTDAARHLIRGRTVLVTGAGGSIGSEIVRQAVSLHAAKVYLLDHDETALHRLHVEIFGDGLLSGDDTILCDVRDQAAVRHAFETVRPNIVFHAAAHKHLPLLERYPAEAIKTNVLGTYNVLTSACATGVRHFVNVSTDKAAAPTSVLGATKRIAEFIVAGYAGGPTRVASVRFGNVLGSRGSLLHSLAAQVRAGQQITITDPLATRYFMTIPEAASLVCEAAALSESGEIYVLDMGEPVRIMDVLLRYLEVTGEHAAGIRFTGLRPGEKLHETLADTHETYNPTEHPLITCTEPDPGAVARSVVRLHTVPDLLDRPDAEELRSHLLGWASGELPVELPSIPAGEPVPARRRLQAV